MTISEFDTKTSLHTEDAIAVLKHCSFDEIKGYVATGHDVRVSELLSGLFFAKDVLGRNEVFDIIVSALFPKRGWMRFGSSVLALKFARLFDCETELRDYLQTRWPSITAKECHEFLLGLAGDVDVASWLSFLRSLFELNANNDVRAELIKVVNSAWKAKKIAYARLLCEELLHKMPAIEKAYSDPNNFAFIGRLLNN